MKRYNNKFRKFDKRTKHNQNKPFEPGRYGKNWGSIKVELAKGAKAINPIPPATQPIIGTLIVGNMKVDITFSEANRIMEELNDAKHRYNVASRMGMLDATTGTPSIYRES
tara:strand:+ start:2032 stop:2364 length:333 start_codon:yes stop_codon:yes gene_type:complete